MDDAGRTKQLVKLSFGAKLPHCKILASKVRVPLSYSCSCLRISRNERQNCLCNGRIMRWMELILARLCLTVSSSFVESRSVCCAALGELVFARSSSSIWISRSRRRARTLSPFACLLSLMLPPATKRCPQPRHRRALWGTGLGSLSSDGAACLRPQSSHGGSFFFLCRTCSGATLSPRLLVMQRFFMSASQATCSVCEGC